MRHKYDRTAEPISPHEGSTGSTNNGVGIIYEIPLRRNFGGGQLPIVLDGDLIHKKYNDKLHLAAVDGHLLIKRHTTTNQITVSVIGGGFVTRCDRGSMCVGGVISHRLGL
jgi:hypothetical protein